MLQRNNRIWCKCQVCKSSSARLIRWYNKPDDITKNFLRKAYSALRDFAWIENCKLLWEILQNSQENTCSWISFSVFSYEFCKICKNTFFTEQHGTTASDYSSINSNEGSIGKRNCKLWSKTEEYILNWARSVNRAVQVKKQVSEAVLCRLQIRCS